MAGATKLLTAGGGGVVLTPASSVGTDVTVSIPSVAGTLLIPGQASAINTGTAVATTSGTAVGFTAIPSWVKRITVMLSGVSTSGTSVPIIQIGSGSYTTTGYFAQSSVTAATASTVSSTTGFPINSVLAANTITGALVLTSYGSNVWIVTGAFTPSTSSCIYTAGSVTLSGTLDQVRITTTNGTDTFDAGSVNILWE